MSPPSFSQGPLMFRGCKSRSQPGADVTVRNLTERQQLALALQESLVGQDEEKPRKARTSWDASDTEEESDELSENSGGYPRWPLSPNGRSHKMQRCATGGSPYRSPVRAAAAPAVGVPLQQKAVTAAGIKHPHENLADAYDGQPPEPKRVKVEPQSDASPPAAEEEAARPSTPTAPDELPAEGLAKPEPETSLAAEEASASASPSSPHISEKQEESAEQLHSEPAASASSLLPSPAAAVSAAEASPHSSPMASPRQPPAVATPEPAERLPTAAAEDKSEALSSSGAVPQSGSRGESASSAPGPHPAHSYTPSPLCPSDGDGDAVGAAPRGPAKRSRAAEDMPAAAKTVRFSADATPTASADGSAGTAAGAAPPQPQHSANSSSSAAGGGEKEGEGFSSPPPKMRPPASKDVESKPSTPKPRQRFNREMASLDAWVPPSTPTRLGSGTITGSTNDLQEKGAAPEGPRVAGESKGHRTPGRTPRVGERRSGRVAALEQQQQERAHVQPSDSAEEGAAGVGTNHHAQPRSHTKSRGSRRHGGPECSGGGHPMSASPLLLRAFATMSAQDAVSAASTSTSTTAAATAATVAAAQLQRLQRLQEAERVHVDALRVAEVAGARMEAAPTADARSLYAGLAGACSVLMRTRPVALRNGRVRSAAEGPVQGFLGCQLPPDVLVLQHHQACQALSRRHEDESATVRSLAQWLCPARSAPDVAAAAPPSSS